MAEVGNLLEKMTDPIAIMTTVVGLIANIFFMRVFRISLVHLGS
jgi:hypothetical protein